MTSRVAPFDEDYFAERKQLLNDLISSPEPIIPIQEFFEHKEIVNMFGKRVTNPMLRNSSEDRYQKKKQEDLVERKSKRVKLNPPPDSDVEAQLCMLEAELCRPPDNRPPEPKLLFTQDVDYSSPARHFFPSRSAAELPNEARAAPGAKPKPGPCRLPDAKERDSKQHLKQKVIDMVNMLFLEG